MTDRELVEQAAQAAGYVPARVTDDGVVLLRGVPVKWSPLTDNGDALRLIVALRMDVTYFEGEVTADASGAWASERLDRPGCEDEATRRAVVRAAAARFAAQGAAA